jgi:hypothetical protein
MKDLNSKRKISATKNRITKKRQTKRITSIIYHKLLVSYYKKPPPMSIDEGSK